MLATVDRNSPIPLYRQIKQILLKELQAADSGADRPFSTEEELIHRFHVSRAPVRQALKELSDEGYVYRERAKGTFPVQGLQVRPPALVLGGLVGYLREQGLNPQSRVADVRHVRPPERVRALLGLGPSDEVLTIGRLILVQGKGLVWSRTYLCVPETYQPSARELEEAGSAFVLLERDLGISLSRAEHQIWATAVGSEEARALGVRKGDPVLVMETKMYTRSGRLGGWRRVIHRADEYKYVFTMSR